MARASLQSKLGCECLRVWWSVAETKPQKVGGTSSRRTDPVAWLRQLHCSDPIDRFMETVTTLKLQEGCAITAQKALHFRQMLRICQGWRHSRASIIQGSHVHLRPGNPSFQCLLRRLQTEHSGAFPCLGCCATAPSYLQHHVRCGT